MAFGAASVIEKLVVKVDVDSAKATKGLDKFGARVGKMAKPAAAVGLALGAMAAKAGQSASRLQQAGGAVDTVFGSSADTIKEWAKAADQSVGLSESAYSELAAGIGAQLKNLGVPFDQVADKTDELIRTGADLSATYGGTTADAVAALGSALRGETDPIEKYGIAIKDATLEAKVGKGNLKKMTDAQKKQAKTTALLGLVHEQAGDAIGAFGRESDTAAGQQQRASAAFEDTAAHLGTVLLPAMTAVAGALAKFASWADRNRTLVLILAGVLGTLAAAVLAVSAAFKVYTAVARVVAIVSRAAWLAALGPVGLVIAAILAVVAVVVVMYKKFDWFKRFVDKVWAGIRRGASVAFAWIRGFVKTVFSAIAAYARSFAAAGKAAFNVVRTVAKVVFTLLTLYVRAWLLVAKVVFTVLKVVARAAFTAVVTVARWATGIVKAALKAVASAASAVWGFVRDKAHAAFSSVADAARSVRDTIAGVLSSIKSKWHSTFDSLRNKAKSALGLVKGPVDAVASAIRSVTDAVSSLIGWIKRIKFPSPPKWITKLPGAGGAAAPAAAVTGLGAGLRPRATSTTTAGGLTINISGALDPAAVAVQIRRILRDDDRRRGRVVPSGGTT